MLSRQPQQCLLTKALSTFPKLLSGSSGNMSSSKEPQNFDKSLQRISYTLLRSVYDTELGWYTTVF